MRPPHELNAIMDANVNRKLTREQCLEILNAPRGASMKAFAASFKVPLSFVQHVRYKCKWIVSHTARPLVLLALVLLGACAKAPYYTPNPNDSCTHARASLVQVAKRLGYTVSFQRVMPGYYGLTTWATREIQIKQGLTSCGEVEVLGHELAHTFVRDRAYTQALEDFCDAVSYHVMAQLTGYREHTSKAAWDDDVDEVAQLILRGVQQ